MMTSLKKSIEYTKANRCVDCGSELTHATAYGREDGLFCDICLERRVDHDLARLRRTYD
jgi:hypothetical protein